MRMMSGLERVSPWVDGLLRMVRRLSGRELKGTCGAPSAVLFSSQPRSVALMLLPRLPLATARRRSRPMALCRSVYMRSMVGWEQPPAM